jgi:hypothetical protein
MAVLPDNDRLRVWRALLRANLSAPNVLKTDLQAAINATDVWIDSNQASFNSALPATFRTNASTAQKTILFCAVALMRVSVEYLKALFGEVE